MNIEPELRAAYAKVVMARRGMKQAEHVLRQEALRVFGKTGTWRIAPGVTIYADHTQMPYALITDLNDLWPETGGVE